MSEDILRVSDQGRLMLLCPECTKKYEALLCPTCHQPLVEPEERNPEWGLLDEPEERFK